VLLFRIGKKRSLSYHGRHHRTILKEPALFVPDFEVPGKLEKCKNRPFPYISSHMYCNTMKCAG